jgi:rhodanese-related sulfurtransferase
LVLVVVFTIGCSKAQISDTEAQTQSPEIQAQITKDISTQEAFALIQSNEGKVDFAIIDVRTPEEFASGHLKNAINLNYNSENFSGELSNLDKAKTYLIYCKGGGRSSSALAIMKELNFMTVYNMLGGITQWGADGLSTVK